MVTFRFYVVSTVAFFLALAVGVVVGSALDERIVESMQDRIDRVEDNLDETVSAIDDKNAQIESLEEYVSASAPYTVEERLTDTAVVVVAEQGIDREPVEQLVGRLRQAGGSVPGILWLQPTWQLPDDESAESLVRALALDSDSDRRLQVAAAEQLVDELLALRTAPPSEEEEAGDITTTAPATSTTSTTTTTAATADGPVASDLPDLGVVRALEDAGFVRFQALDGDTTAGPAARLALVGVTGSGSELEVPGEPVATLADVAAREQVAAVLADVFRDVDGGPGRGQQLADLVGSSAVSTVDDLELESGRVAVVLALEAWEDGVVGRYGYGPDTDGVLPEWRAP